MDSQPTYKNLRGLNTFGVDAATDAFASIRSADEFKQLLKNFPDLATQGLVLGGGSNVLFTGPPETGVIKPDITGITLKDTGGDSVLVTAGSGVVWHDLVLFSLDHGLSGIENLSLIPGNCGAAPMQNIGAYGVELQQVFSELKAIERSTGRLVTFDADSCGFGYRNSVFKHELRDQYIITSITLQLSRKPQINTSYGTVSQTLEEMGISNPGPGEVSKAIIRIRSSKLPDWNKTGNAGSFFKNPVISADQAQALREEWLEMPSYDAGPSQIKIPAAWLIQQSGWKGIRQGDAGTWPLQPLVLVNYGQASGADILALARAIRDDVHQQFGIRLEPEVNLIGMKQSEF